MATAVVGWATQKADTAFVRSAIARLVERAVQDSVEIDDPGIPPPAASPVRTTIYLKPHVAGAVRVIARRFERPVAAVCRALVEKLVGEWGGEPLIGTEAAAADHPIVVLNLRVGAAVRPNQARIYDYVLDALDKRRIGMVEAGTGTGKTRAEVAAAIEIIRCTGESACIAVPTFRVMDQVVAEYVVQARGDQKLPDIRIVRGRREFVSADLFDRFVRSAPADVVKAAAKLRKRWERAAANGDPAWLIGDLSALPDIPADEVRIEEDCPPGDLGFISYREQFRAEEPGAPILIVCSHAMLAQDARRKVRAIRKDEIYAAVQAEMSAIFRKIAVAKSATKRAIALGALTEKKGELEAVASRLGDDGVDGLLPAHRYLIVDEAHLLEPTFSASMSDRVSLSATLRLLLDVRAAGGRGVTGDLVDAARKSIDDLKSSGTPGAFFELNQHVESGRVVRRLIVSLEAALPARGFAKNDELATLQGRLARAISILRVAVRNGGGMRGYLSFSPSRSYPQIYVGPNSVEGTLGAMWSLLSGGAALSATLYTTNSSGASARYHATLMAVPIERLAEYPPVTETWTRSPVTLHVPDEDAEWVLPPDRNASVEDEAAWTASVARNVSYIRSRAIGGVMVLMTSYDTARAVAAGLGGSGDVILADGDTPIKTQITRFLEARLAGRPAVWIAVGGAWTGVDIGGHSDIWKEVSGGVLPAADDNVLTDLCIPRLPYGMNQSLSFRWRVENQPGFPWHALDAYFFFKQGLGRLIRREGLPENRRIWVLDGRLVETSAATSRTLFWNEINRYPRIVPVKPVVDCREVESTA